MAMSDLLFRIFLIPLEIQTLYKDSWLIGGPFGQVLCKLVAFLTEVSSTVSFQSLVLIAVDRFGAVVFPLRSPLISSNLCLFIILATWIVAIAVYSPVLFVCKVVEHPEKLVCQQNWNELFGESSSHENYFVSCIVVFTFIPLVLITILYVTILLKLKSQRIPGEQSANAGQQRQQRERNVLKMAIAIVLGFTVWGEALQIIARAQQPLNPFYILRCGHVLNGPDPIWMLGDAITAKEMAHPGNLPHFELQCLGV
ncbi:RYamide receptor-like [Orbicella faveolata]|uniref:RYamide receptor-like n=1 Tax=Orbicella faveolata TaxID=48498 RepID=UPI0009E29F2B|nr:RYamide receptor-like [Orbicella faveolata]